LKFLVKFEGKNRSAELCEHEEHFLLLKLALNPEYVVMSRNTSDLRVAVK